MPHRFFSGKKEQGRREGFEQQLFHVFERGGIRNRLHPAYRMARRFIHFAMPGNDETGNMDDAALRCTAAGASDGGESLDIKELPVAVSQASFGSHLQHDGH